jgi:hypothetical protein
METVIVVAFLTLCVCFEWLSGNYRSGGLNRTDLKMAVICTAGISLIQRPLVMAMIFAICGLLLAPYQGVLTPLQDQYFGWTLLVFILLEEFFHGLGHWFSHSRTPKSSILKTLHNIFRTAHRPHHLIGNDDGKEQITVGQTFVEGWTYWLVMPNIWFSFIALYLGLTEVFVYGMVIKGVWSLHVHTNWHYDLYFLNHPNVVVRKIAYGLAHIFTFPTTHHHHHSRGANSAKNLHNFLSLYDWLIYGTLKIETSAPKRFGWRQKEQEKTSAWYRFSRTYD